MKIISNFPKHFIEYWLSLVLSVMNDYTLMTLAIAAILAGFVFESVLIGAFFFFAFYAVLRIISNVAEAIGFGATRIAQASLSRERPGTEPPAG